LGTTAGVKSVLPASKFFNNILFLFYIMPRKGKTNDEYLKEIYIIHGRNKYDYSLVNYINNKTKIKIGCKIHNIFFEKRADAFLNKKSMCPKCHYDSKKLSQLKDNEYFIHQLIEKHGNFYDYSNVNYSGANNSVLIICPLHKEIRKTPKTLLQNPSLCRKCDYRDTKKFIEESKKIHGNRYLYDKVNYFATNKKVIITCPKNNHGDFKQEPRLHLKNVGCPVCKISKGEKKVMEYLEKNKIIYLPQQKYVFLGETIIFDFFLPNKNVIIEFDGKQHFQTSLMGKYEDNNRKDIHKTSFCFKNNINLIRIHFRDIKNIDSFLYKTLKNIKKRKTNIYYSRENYYPKGINYY
jgi:very-short-patch-repair endonuclease